MLKSEKGLTGIDIVLAIIIVMLFTSIILSLMYNIKQQNLKQIYAMASNIYITETLENIGIADYEDVVATTSENISELIPELPEMIKERIECKCNINGFDSPVNSTIIDNKTGAKSLLPVDNNPIWFCIMSTIFRNRPSISKSYERLSGSAAPQHP